VWGTCGLNRLGSLERNRSLGVHEETLDELHKTINQKSNTLEERGGVNNSILRLTMYRLKFRRVRFGPKVSQILILYIILPTRLQYDKFWD
jgi:hypothetical protein